MATKKAKAKAPKKKRRRVYRRRGRFRDMSPKHRQWRLWVHDVDTLMHEMVKNPAYQDLSPEQLVAKVEAFADAYHAMQDRRRPPGVELDGY